MDPVWTPPLKFQDRRWLHALLFLLTIGSTMLVGGWAYTDGRHPDAVTFSSAREDALRRDFTINGMFFDPLDGEVIDYVGGRADLDARVLRAIGDPAERFREDKLRLLRAARFATRFRLALDPATADAVRTMAKEIVVVSAERIADELRKLLTDPNRGEGVRLLQRRGATVSYHDPHVRKLKDEGIDLASVPLTPETVTAADCVVIVTDHSDVDYALVERCARLVVDTRNALEAARRQRQAP